MATVFENAPNNDLDKFQCLEDYEGEARSKLTKAVWDYIANEACLLTTTTENVSAYKKYSLYQSSEICNPLVSIQILHTSTSSV